MALKDILVYMSDCDGNAPLAQAIVLARTHNAHLTGLYLAPLGEYLKQEARQQAFQSAAGAAGIDCEWISASGDFSSPVSIAKIFNSYARLTDLTILCQEATVAARLHHGKVLESVILGSGRPVLMLPDDQHDTVIGKQVVIAWDYSKEAARAVNDALPLLRSADKVEVVTVGIVSAPPNSEGVPGTALCKHLERHGVTATASKIQAPEANIGEAIIASAESVNADLIVAGAYGRSDARDLMLADVTGTLLKEVRSAIFLSH